MAKGSAKKRLCTTAAKIAAVALISAQLSGCVFVAAAVGAGVGVYAIQHYRVKVSKKKTASSNAFTRNYAATTAKTKHITQHLKT
jgi:hypothetical protein